MTNALNQIAVPLHSSTWIVIAAMAVLVLVSVLVGPKRNKRSRAKQPNRAEKTVAPKPKSVTVRVYLRPGKSQKEWMGDVVSNPLVVKARRMEDTMLNGADVTVTDYKAFTDAIASDSRVQDYEVWTIG